MKKSLGATIHAMPSPVWVVGSYGNKGEPNMMTVAWVGICCSSPPCIAVSLQKSRLTYANILEHKAFTISIPSKQYAMEADYIGIVSGKNTDKFSVTGLTPVKSNIVDAPYVKEFPIVIECTLLNTVDIGLHTQFIGEIVDVKADEEVLGEKGVPAIDKVDPIICSASDRTYYALGEYLGQAYALGLKLSEEKIS
ncbi:MAG TPA: flavin reductase family protein [Desulfosporosinus sp.]|nr:flavin reductase family protein [Desulfosporosinus sp.]